MVTAIRFALILRFQIIMPWYVGSPPIFVQVWFGMTARTSTLDTGEDMITEPFPWKPSEDSGVGYADFVLPGMQSLLFLDIVC